MKFIEFIFYIKNEQSIDEDIAKWCELRQFIEGAKVDGEKSPSYSEILIYEDSTLKMSGTEMSDWLEIRISPYLKEVSIVHFHIDKRTYIQHKDAILEFMDAYSKRKCVMLGHGHFGYNKYREIGYGHVEVGIYWITWLNEWIVKYLDKHQIDILSKYTKEIDENESYIKIEVAPEPWEIETMEKEQRWLMKHLKLENTIMKYNKKREFSYIED